MKVEVVVLVAVARVHALFAKLSHVARLTLGSGTSFALALSLSVSHACGVWPGRRYIVVKCNRIYYRTKKRDRCLGGGSFTS